MLGWKIDCNDLGFGLLTNREICDMVAADIGSGKFRRR